MNKDKLKVIAELIYDILDEGEPTDEQLDYDEDAIQVYADLHNLKESLEAIGIYGD